MDNWQEAGFGIYIHWPFCEAKCPYCDFNSHVTAKIDHDDWRRAYLSEIDRYGARLKGRVVQSIFFGGGTPSLMRPGTVGAIIERIQTHWPTSNSLEITLEANPSSVEVSRFRAYRAVGVNRVSIGLQALNDQDLKRLGRLHSAAEGRAAVATAQQVFDRFSFDLIYARQDQSLSAWEKELRDGITISGEHLSLYQLTIEPDTAFGARHSKGGLKGLPDEDLGADLYDLTQDICEDAGLPAYEISNHCNDLSGSIHNLIYWRGGDYVGIGPGAHGRLTIAGERLATETELQPKRWLERVKTSGHGEVLGSVLEPEDAAAEYLMMSLRLIEGSDLGRFNRLSSKRLAAERLATLSELGLITYSSDRLKVTRQGRPVLNAILRDLLT